MAPKRMADVLHAPNLLCYFLCYIFLHCLYLFKCIIILYIMLLLLSLMTENNFWTSEQWLLTTNWKKHFPLTSLTRRIYCSPGNRPKSPSFAWRKDGGKEDTDRAAFWESVYERVNSHCHLLYWLTCKHWKIKLMTYDYDYSINGILKTVVS